MKRRRVLPLLPLLAFLAGCSASWKLQTGPPSAQVLQWPYAPNRAKLTYERALTGLTSSATAASVLAALAYGKEPADANSFVLPVAVATATDGRMAVADMGRGCVHLFIPAEARYVRLGGPRTAPMQTPVAVLFDDQRRLFVSDSSGRVYAFGTDGAPLFVVGAAGPTPFRRPTGLAFSPKQKLLYVVDTLEHRIYAVDSKGDVTKTIGERGDGDGQFNFPTHIAWSPPGELVVADSLNFRIQILDEEGKFLGAFGRHGDGSGDLAMPKGLAVDRDGVIYVADSLFDVIQLFDRRGEFLLTLGRRGTEAGEFWMPAGLFIDDRGELYVSDTYNHRIQVFRITDRYAEPSR